jgi:hypothetical protein
MFDITTHAQLSLACFAMSCSVITGKPVDIGINVFRCYIFEILKFSFSKQCISSAYLNVAHAQ